MKYFCMPADFKKETIDKYFELNNSYPDSKITETYGQITLDNTFESGRNTRTLPKVSKDDLASYIKYSRDRNIEFNYTINASHMNNREFTNEGVLAIRKLLNDLYEIGIRSLTICLPSIIEIVKSTKLDFDIKASVICQITNPNKALIYKELGVNRIVIDESLNRKFEDLKRIKDAFGDGIELIVNSICHTDCTNRMFHYNQISSDCLEVTSEASANYYLNRCAQRVFKDISSAVKLSWIRPEDMKYYTEIGIKRFKIQGRHSVLSGDPIRAIESYINESYQGNLWELLHMFSHAIPPGIYLENNKLDGFIKTFYENKEFCKNYCESCGYCQKYALKCIDYDKEKSVARVLNRVISSRDPFTNLINSISDK